jgi:hypothetical protein
MKKWWLIVLLLPFASLSQEQEKEKDVPRLNLHVIASGGVATGEKDTKAVAQLSGGLVFGSFFTGAGIGIDFYHFKTIPVFADLRYSFGPKKALFVYANGGYHFTATRNFEPVFATKDVLKGGLYLDGGFGVQVIASPKDRVGISFGFSRKSNVHIVRYSPCGGTCPDEVVSRSYYTFNRIVSKLSWNFGR